MIQGQYKTLTRICPNEKTFPTSAICGTTTGQVEEARPLFLAAWELARNAREDYHAVDAAHMPGICKSADASVMWNNRAMEVVEAPAGYVFEEIARCLLTLERPNEARPYFDRVYQELSKGRWLKENERERLERLRRLGEGQSC
ncbi:MAG: hypothetical protein OXG98_14575 [Gemmatimonadetes bacterium]|nr:hypothetical protein [Gemmatimonadota bacterium]